MKENKYIRVIICLAMSLCMLFTTTKVAYASNLDNSFTKIDDLEKTRYHKIRQYVENFLSMNMCEQKIVDSYPLYDLNNEMIAVLFNLEIGYIIINIKDFSIPEFTFERKSIYSPNSQKKFYNGAFEYFENIDDNYMKNLYDNKKVDIKNFDRSNLYGEDSVYTKSLPMSTTSSIYLSTTNINDIVRCITTDTPFIANDGHGNTGVSMDISQSDMIIG